MAERFQGNPIGDEWDSGEYHRFHNLGGTSMDTALWNMVTSETKRRSDPNKKISLIRKTRQIIEDINSLIHSYVV